MDIAGQQGLSAADVAERVRRGETNAVAEATSRTYADILRGNVFTLFNLILGAGVAVILVLGSPRDALFGLVVVLNAAVGVVQEVRAKLTLDRLSLLSAPRARVVRDGRTIAVGLGEVVSDDIVGLDAGDQVPADGEVTASDGLEVDESLVTGEAAAVAKRAGDAVLSGSFAVGGSGAFRVGAVGIRSYAGKLASEARRFELTPSELRAGVDGILRIVLWLAIPIGVLTLISQIREHSSASAAAVSTVAAVEGMVPQGLVLLTSIAFAVAVIALGRRGVLVQELAAVEVLARVDVVCVDKTGTLTEPAVEVERLEALRDAEGSREALGALAALEANPTTVALSAAYAAPDGWQPRGRVPFDSARKWSGADFGERGTWVMGAPEVLLADGHGDELRKAVEASRGGHRVVLLCRTRAMLTPERPPAPVEPMAFVLLGERLRPDAARTLTYFRDQGVAVKVLSGDSPATAGAVAERAGLDASDPVDARTLPRDDGELAALVEERTVFGRISPEDKRRVVGALRRSGHVVAMTGDGVNDVLALKAADLGVAMGSGAGSARTVAQMVLLDGQLATLPDVVAEGRRVIADVETVANLFLAKSTYAVLIAVATAVAALPFPFLPRHLTLVAALTIGIPSFFLALAPNSARYRPGFVERVLRFALPCGVAAAAGSFAAYAVLSSAGAPLMEARTAGTLSLTLIGLWILGSLIRPLLGWRLRLVGAMGVAAAAALLVPFARSFFALSVLPPPSLGVVVLAAAGGALLVAVGLRVSRWRQRQ